MKKILFAAILVGCFFIAKPAFATGESGRLTVWQDIWDAINDLKNQVISIQGEQSALKRDMVSGLACWDINGNGKRDPEEDKNQDGNFDAMDCQGPPADSSQIQPGVMRYVYSAAIPGSIGNADYVSENSNGGIAGKNYFMKVDTPQISVSDMPLVSLYGKEDSENVRLGGDAWQSNSAYTYIKDGSIYILYAGEEDGQEPIYYLPKGAYKVVVVY